MLRHWSQFVPNMSTDIRGMKLNFIIIPLFMHRNRNRWGGISSLVPYPSPHTQPLISLPHFSPVSTGKASPAPPIQPATPPQPPCSTRSVITLTLHQSTTDHNGEMQMRSNRLNCRLESSFSRVCCDCHQPHQQASQKTCSWKTVLSQPNAHEITTG